MLERYAVWLVRPQIGVDADGKPIPGPQQRVELVSPLSLDEARERWQPGPGNPGLFNGRRVCMARPVRGE